MKIVITGALGHIGSYVIRKLAYNFKGAEIIMIDNLMTQRYSSLFNLPKEGNYHFIEADLTSVDLLPLFQDANVVLHLAAITDATGSYLQSEKIQNNNYLSTERVAFACIETGAKLIIPSSTSVYGTKENIVSEDCSKTDLMPQSPYAKIKLKEEELISRLCKEKDLKAIICRLGTIFGISPGMRFHTAVNKFCWQAVMRQPLTVWSTALEQKRPYLDLHDASRVFSYIIRNNMFDSHIYNIITLNTTVREIIDMIRLYVPDINVTLVDNRAMNNLSFEVSREKFLKKGFDFSGDLQRCIIETLELISQKRLNHTL